MLYKIVKKPFPPDLPYIYVGCIATKWGRWADPDIAIVEARPEDVEKEYKKMKKESDKPCS